MATLRMISVELEVDGVANCAEIIRLALGGGDVATVHTVIQERPSLPAPEIEEPAPASRRRGNGVQGEPGTGERKHLHATPSRPLAGAKPVDLPPVELHANAKADGPSQKILALLAKKPMSSGELIDALRCEPPYVYQTCSHLKAKGHIESRVDDDPSSDGTRRYFLVKGNAA